MEYTLLLEYICLVLCICTYNIRHNRHRRHHPQRNCRNMDINSTYGVS